MRAGWRIAGAVVLVGTGTALATGARSRTPEAYAPNLAVDHATLGVANLEVEKAFYHDVLGFDAGKLRRRPAYDVQPMSISGFRIDLIAQGGSTRPSPSMLTDKQGWLHLAFKTRDVEKFIATLTARGVLVTRGRVENQTLVSIFVTDPEGNRLEIAQS